jgi:hypothetical protein
MATEAQLEADFTSKGIYLFCPGFITVLESRSEVTLRVKGTRCLQ